MFSRREDRGASYQLCISRLRRFFKMDIYVGNLSFDASEDDVRGAFATFGTVESVKMIMDRETGRPRGFAFVTMTESDEATNATESLNVS